MPKGKGPRPEPLPPFDEDEPVLPLTNAARSPASHDPMKQAIDAVGKKMDRVIDEAREYGKRAIEAHESIASEAVWARRLHLVAVASDNGKATVEESRARLERMLALLDDMDEIEERLFPPDDEDDGDEDVLSNRVID